MTTRNDERHAERSPSSRRTRREGSPEKRCRAARRGSRGAQPPPFELGEPHGGHEHREERRLGDEADPSSLADADPTMKGAACSGGIAAAARPPARHVAHRRGICLSGEHPQCQRDHRPAEKPTATRSSVAPRAPRSAFARQLESAPSHTHGAAGTAVERPPRPSTRPPATLPSARKIATRPSPPSCRATLRK